MRKRRVKCAREERRVLKLWHQLTCLDIATQKIAHRYFSPLKCKKSRKKNYSEVSPVAQTERHSPFSSAFFTRKLFSTRHGEFKIKVKPEGPREANLNYLEILDQYLSTFDNMLIICTPQNSMPPAAIGWRGQNPLLRRLPIGPRGLHANERVADIGRDSPQRGP